MCGPMDTGLSGGDVHALRLCERLAREGGHHVRLIGPASLRERIPASVQPYLVGLVTPLEGRLTSMPRYLLTVVLRMVAALRGAPASRVVVASSHFFFDVIPAAWLSRRNGALVATYVYHLVAESNRAVGLRSAVSATLERLSLAVLRRAADVVFVDNPETLEALRARGFGAHQLVLTQNAYDPLEPVAPARATDHPSIVFVGRLVEVKGVWDMLELARRLQGAVPAARISMIGDGPLRDTLARRIEDEGIDNLELLGFVSEDEKWRQLRSASLFVSPSWEEGWGIAVGEALVAGVPAVVYDLPAYGHFGDLVLRAPTRDRAAFIRTAVELLREPERLARARAQVEAGQEDLPRWESVLAQELAVLKLGAPGIKLGGTSPGGA